MKKIIVYIFICLTIVLSPSCDDSLRIDERQTSFDVNYFTYSRYQLTTAIVNTAQSYGTVPESDPDRQVTLCFAIVTQVIRHLHIILYFKTIRGDEKLKSLYESVPHFCCYT